jgi:phage-related protein
MSADADYEKPIIAFTTNSIGNAFTITNTTDDSRQFIFTGISPLETITVNNRLQTIVSSLSLARASTFNKKFFRLVPGLNSINIAGGISNFTMTTQNAMKIGG